MLVPKHVKNVINCTSKSSSAGLPKLAQNYHLKTTNLWKLQNPIVVFACLEKEKSRSPS